VNNTKITKRVLTAVDRILLDGRSINVMMNGQIATEDGYAITDGFVLSSLRSTDGETK